MREDVKSSEMARSAIQMDFPLGRRKFVERTTTTAEETGSVVHILGRVLINLQLNAPANLPETPLHSDREKRLHEEERNQESEFSRRNFSIRNEVTALSSRSSESLRLYVPVR